MTVPASLRTASVAACTAILAGCGGPREAGTHTPSPDARATLAAEAGPFRTDLVDGLTTEVDLPFTQVTRCGSADCTVPVDVLAPREGRALPTVVLVPGGPVEFQHRRYLDLLAAAIARRGAVVLLTSYRSPATGSTDGDMLADIRCSVRHARSVTGDYGGDPERVVLVGHSIGSTLVLEIAVTPETETPDCLAAGFQAQYRELKGTSHEEMVDPDATPEVLDVVFEAAARAARQTKGPPTPR